ncbi:MAG: PHP domain-containing protein [Bacteroidota bacterium]
MMTNKEIANSFNQLAKIMELHGENKFKIRSYSNAYLTLRKLGEPLAEMSDKEISGIKGVGNAISGKIRELLDNGHMQTLQKYLDKTPPGIVEMLGIKGFGPKKIKSLWDGLGVETIGELLYACNENRLVELKGFGLKTQDDLRQKLEYFLQSRDKYHYARLETEAIELLGLLQKRLPEAAFHFTGALRRRATILEAIELLVVSEQDLAPLFDEEVFRLEAQEGQLYQARTEKDSLVYLYQCNSDEQGSKQFRYTATDDFMKAFIAAFPKQDFRGFAEEKAIFEKVNIAYIPPELREGKQYIEAAKSHSLPTLVAPGDIRGIVHSHTTYSDGLHSLEEMATYAKEEGFDYILITDHSKSAFYANGLQPERVLAQMQEIDALNEQLAPFKIYKGIESDILGDGSLDYEDDILEKFDVVIASVHSNLKMDLEKATQRLLTAIENPHTRILGHPTGRLLLSRKGYPIDHKRIIDACAAHHVALELNANPYRLDLDWTWIPYALEKGVLVAINPDAHSQEGMHDIRYGVLAARKGALPPDRCLTAFSREDFEKWVVGDFVG